MKKIWVMAACFAMPMAVRGAIVPLNGTRSPVEIELERELRRIETIAAMGGVEDVPEFPAIAGDNGEPLFFVQRRGAVSDAQIRNQIRIALQKTGDSGDNWAWRDGAEEKLVGLGSGAVSSLEAEWATHDSFEADAIAVALFRIQNEGVHPNETLREWGAKRFPGPDPATLKVLHVIDNKQTPNLRELFPHHIFYAVENPKDKTRAVVALAADGKVQAIEDDAALAKFLRSEGGAQAKDEGKRRMAAAAAVLAAARMVSPAKPDPRLDAASTGEQFSSTLDADGVSTGVALTFAADGKLESMKTTQTGAPTPTTVPSTGPAIPRGRRGGVPAPGAEPAAPVQSLPPVIRD
jgi:hypothetical protein